MANEEDIIIGRRYSSSWIFEIGRMDKMGCKEGTVT